MRTCLYKRVGCCAKCRIDFNNYSMRFCPVIRTEISVIVENEVCNKEVGNEQKQTSQKVSV